MKKTKLFRIACLCFAVIFVFLAMPFSASAISNIDNTRVYEDLQTMGTDLSLYKPSSELRTPKIIEFLEYAYDQNNNQSDFGLYLYVYNPSTDKVVTNSQYNTVQISTRSTAGNVTSNKKYKLQFISVSTSEDGEGLDRLYYKFKVATDPLLLTNLSKDRRVYDVVDLELQYEGEYNPRSANVSNSYICTGYQAYHHTDPHTGKLLDTSTHYCVAQNLETIEIELHPATWKTISSDKGDHYQYEVSSVYFSIPDYYLEKYGNMADEDFKGLYAVDGEWYEYKINGIVSNNHELINTAEDYLGIVVTKNDLTEDGAAGALQVLHPDRVNFVSLGMPSYVWNLYYSSKVPFGFSSLYNGPDGFFRLHVFNRCFNYGESYYGYGEGSLKNFISPIPGICNAIYSSSTNGLLVSTKDLLSSIYGDTGELLALEYVDAGRTLGHNTYHISVEDDSLNNLIAAYATDANHLRQWLSGKGWHTSEDATGYDEMRPIVMVDPDEFSAFSTDEAMSKEYFICEEDVDSFENFALDQKDRTTYLMRFAVTDYYVDEVDITDNDGTEYTGTHHYFEKTIFHNFDVLSFTFKSEEGKYTTVPVSSKPISIVGNITEDPDDEFKEWLDDTDDDNLFPNWLRLVIFIAGAMLILVVITKLYGFLNKQRNVRLDTKLKRAELRKSEDNLGYARDENTRKWNTDRRDEDKNKRDWNRDGRDDHEDRRRDNADRRADSELNLKRNRDKREAGKFYIDLENSRRADADLKLRRNRDKRENAKLDLEYNKDRRAEERHQERRRPKQ